MNAPLLYLHGYILQRVHAAKPHGQAGYVKQRRHADRPVTRCIMPLIICCSPPGYTVATAMYNKE